MPGELDERARPGSIGRHHADTPWTSGNTSSAAANSGAGSGCGDVTTTASDTRFCRMEVEVRRAVRVDRDGFRADTSMWISEEPC